MRAMPSTPPRGGAAVPGLHPAGFAALVVALAACSPAPEPPPPPPEPAWEVKIPLGLSPDLLAPADNPVTREKVRLGRKLYFDARLSIAGDVSCATCHHPDHAFTDNQPVSTGHQGQKGGRSAPTVFNATYNYLQFWDGRAASLEEQALGPIQNPIEMGNTLDGMIATLNAAPEYRPHFLAAFGDPVITPDRVAKAIASFERTVLSGNSKWDRYNAGDLAALSDAEKRGWELFKGKAQCTLCHAGQNFSDSDFHNLGVGIGNAKPDLGRYEVTREDKDRGAFKTPTVREIARTAPYMHDGGQKALEEVVEFYNRGGERNKWLDPKIRPLNLTPEEKADLVVFLHALNGESPQPVGPPG